MEKYNNIVEQLKLSMTIDGVVHRRFYHSLEVAKKALEINDRLDLGLDPEIVYLTGLLHDAAKLKDDEYLWAIIVDEFNGEETLEKKFQKVFSEDKLKESFFADFTSNSVANINI